MNIKEGMTLWAINPCVMDGSGKPTLTVGKSYAVLVIREDVFTVTDDDRN